MTSALIVVLNWNGIKDTEKCLESLFAQSYGDYSIVVVDNGSVDNSLARLRKIEAVHADKLTILANNTNKGFAGGVNTGIKYAIDNGFEYVALFNNDAVADKNWLKELVAAHTKKTGISTSLLLHQDGKTIDSSGDWYSKWGLMFPRNRGDKVENAAESGFVFGASGGASLYKTAMFQDIGLFDEDFFLYYEDGDISFRAQLAGWQVFYTNKALAYHKQGASSKKVPGLAIYHTFKNLPLIFTKNVPKGLRWSIGIRFKLAYLLILLNAIAHGNGGPALKGAFMSLTLEPKALWKRAGIQKKKRVSAEYIRNIIWDDLPPEQTGLRKFRKFFTGKA